MLLGTLLAWLALYAFIMVCYISTLKYLSGKPSASLLASAQHYPELSPVRTA